MYCVTAKKPDGHYIGTAININNYMVTCKHIVEDSKQIVVYNGNEQKKIEFIPIKHVDIAVSKLPEYVESSSMVFGYNVDSTDDVTIHFYDTTKNIKIYNTKQTGVYDNEIITSILLDPMNMSGEELQGISGGIVVNKKNEILGIVSCYSNAINSIMVIPIYFISKLITIKKINRFSFTTSLIKITHDNGIVQYGHLIKSGKHANKIIVSIENSQFDEKGMIHNSDINHKVSIYTYCVFKDNVMVRYVDPKSKAIKLINILVI